MNQATTLGALEAIVDASGVAPVIEALLPTGGRPRQLRVRTLVVGTLMELANGRPAHLSRVHEALVSLPHHDQCRLGVVVAWRSGPHTLTYRQVERTFALVAAALGGQSCDGAPSEALAAICDDLIEASIPTHHKDATTALGVDWTDHESWSRPPGLGGQSCSDPDASWGHRRGHAPGANHEAFFGYYLQAATMVAEEGGPPVAELVRRVLLTSAKVDPPRALVKVLSAMQGAGIALGDVLADSGYAHRAGGAWAVPLRRLGARLVQDLHPADRGPKGTFGGAVVANGRLYCPATPAPLLELGPAPAHARAEHIAAHDAKSAELSRYKLGRASADDADGFHRVRCPAVDGKLRCPLRPASLSLGHDRPEVLAPPQTPPRCCSQQTMTVPPEVNAKTTQKHDYPSAAHRVSYARRTASERTFATIKDPATTDVGRGWCRVMGLPAITLFLVCAIVVRNGRVLRAFEARQVEDAKRLAAGLPPKTRRRRRRTLADLVEPAPP